MARVLQVIVLCDFNDLCQFVANLSAGFVGKPNRTCPRKGVNVAA